MVKNLINTMLLQEQTGSRIFYKKFVFGMYVLPRLKRRGLCFV